MAADAAAPSMDHEQHAAKGGGDHLLAGILDPLVHRD